MLKMSLGLLRSSFLPSIIEAGFIGANNWA